MFLLISLLLVAQGAVPASDYRWDSPDVLIEDSLGPMVSFAADYNYTTGDIYVGCMIDSGYYFEDDAGWMIFRSQDHGSTWETIFAQPFPATWDVRDIDIVATRNDTLYVLSTAYNNAISSDHIELDKFYESVSGWTLTTLFSKNTSTAEYLSPVLVRDDFEPFHLYSAYILNIEGDVDSLILEKSTDKGKNWSILERRYAPTGYYCDCDLTISDSTLYLTYSSTADDLKSVRTRVRGNRGTSAPPATTIIQTTSDTINADIEYPRIGSTTTLPDSTQLVYALFSQRNATTENWDLLYKYSLDGGDNWSSDIDTIRQGSYGPVLSDIRGYEVAPNPYMDITYCVTSRVDILFTYNNYFRWSSEGDPTNWHDITDVSGGLFSSVPEIVYSPGGSAPGAGVVYNDFMGNLYFDAPWYSGIAENLKEHEEKIRSEVVLPGSVVKLGSAGATVYDITGREITKLTGDSWDLKDTQGKKVNCGIYLIANEKTGERVKILIPVK
jgi:hypothetical protein